METQLDNEAWQVPIIERDPWREQYFEGVACADDVVIPTDDEHAYELWPRHRWIYNKLLICDSQGIRGAPHGVDPPRFPVFSKPIYNMSGMGVDGMVIHSRAEMERNVRAGHMWMELLDGDHVSSDVIVVDGEPRWWRHSVGLSLGGGTFDYWTIRSGRLPSLEEYCGAWLGEHLRSYTGAVNLETIGGRIIEAHLRFADQWPDLYGRGWLEAVVDLYTCGRWSYADHDRRDGYSVVLFAPHGSRHIAPPRPFIDALAARSQVSSVQVTFHEDLAPELHAMPPGGFRLAVVNCWDLGSGLRARDDLDRAFRSAPHAHRRGDIRRLRRVG